MMDMQAMSAKQRNMSKGRTRSGCVTCKIRHVKCDEQKPECAECRRTGRKCDGYMPLTNSAAKIRTGRPVSKPQLPEFKPESRLILYPGTREERQHVQFFCTRSANAMSGLFHSDFWTYYLPQLCQTVPVLRHAAAAVAARHEFLLHSQAAPKEANETFALQQYNKAIGHLRDHISTKNPKIEITVIACFLFVGLEMLHGNPMQALNHMQGGVRILHKHGLSHGWANNLPENIENELLHFVLRMNLQLSLFGRQLTPFDWDTIDQSSRVKAWSDISQARHALDQLMNKGLQFARYVGLERPLPSIDMTQQHHKISSEFQGWKIKFDRLMKLPRKKITTLDPRIPLLLRILHRVSSLLVRSCLKRSEMGYDEHNSSFERVVYNAEKWADFDKDIRQVTDNDGNCPGNFTLEAGIIPMLYWTATKCRHPVLRRRAIKVLRNYPTREGLWNAGFLAAVAANVVAIEERNVNHLPIEERLPSDKDRAYEVFLGTGEETNLPQQSNIQLWFKPEGADGPWVSKLMYISEYANETYECP